MKQIVMTTITDEAVVMGTAGVFKTGVPVEVENDDFAKALLNRNYPKFREASETDFQVLIASDDKKKSSK